MLPSQGSQKKSWNSYSGVKASQQPGKIRGYGPFWKEKLQSARTTRELRAGSGYFSSKGMRSYPQDLVCSDGETVPALAALAAPAWAQVSVCLPQADPRL